MRTTAHWPWSPPPLWERAREGGTPQHVPAGFPPPLTPPQTGEGKLRALLLAATVVLCAPAQAEIRIGLAAPLTGHMAQAGLAMQRALEAAVAETNSAGGVLGEPLALVVEDDGCASATAEGAAGLLIKQQPALVIGHPCASAATAAAALYGKADVLLVAVGPRHPDVTRATASLPVPPLRLAGRDDRQGAEAARWLLAHAPGRRVAILHDRTRYQREIADRAVAALAAADGVIPVAVIPIVAGKHDYEAAVLALRDSGAEAVLLAGYPSEAAIVVAGIGRIGLDIPVLGSDTLATAEFAERVATTSPRVQVLLPARPGPAGASNGSDADAYGREARGALEAWMEAARKASTVNARTLSEALRSLPIATRALGEIRFDQNGDLDTRAFAAASARAGRWVIEER